MTRRKRGSLTRKLTDDFIRRLPPSLKPIEYRDTAVRNLLVRITRGGTRSFYVTFPDKRRVMLGHWGSMLVEDARREANKLLTQSTEAPAAGGTMTFRRFVDTAYRAHALAELRQEPRVVGTMLARLMALPFADKPLRSIAFADVKDWRDARQQHIVGRTGEPIKKSSIDRETNNIRSVLSYAVQRDLLRAHPLGRGKLKPLDKDTGRIPKALDSEQLRRLKATLAARRASLPRHCALIELALNTGLRRKEMLDLAAAAFDAERGTLTVAGSMSKSGKTRVVALNAAALRALKGLGLPVRDFLPNPDKSIHTIFKEAGLSGYGLHSLRHTFATRLLQSGEDIRTVQELLGHHSPDITAIYTVPTEARKAAAVKRLRF